MKKVLALVLAVAMLATTAFAAILNPASSTINDFKNYLPGDTIKINDSGIVAAANANKFTADETNPPKYDLASRNPGATESTLGDGTVLIKSINSDNYTITNIKFYDGKKLVAGGSQGIKISDTNERVEIKLVQDYVRTSERTLDVEFTLKGKKVGKNYKPENITIRAQYTVGYKLDSKNLTISKNGDVKVEWKDSSNTAVKVDNGSYVDSGKGMSKVFAESKAVLWEVKKAANNDTENYGDLDYTTADPDVDITVRVYDGDKLYLYSNVDPDTDILKQFADEEADITFLNHPNTTFNAMATVRIYKEEGDTYFYEWVDGGLVDMNGKANSGAAGINKKVNWDDDEGCYILKTRTMPETMIMSDKPLPIEQYQAPADGDTTPNNPDTGANDVVGIATALAAVALVSAAAISLKK